MSRLDPGLSVEVAAGLAWEGVVATVAAASEGMVAGCMAGIAEGAGWAGCGSARRHIAVAEAASSLALRDCLLWAHTA